MNRHFFKKAFFILLLVLSCSSCADVPEQVNEEISILDKNDVLDNEGLSLVLADGRRFPLRFDCKNCQMLVLAPDAKS